MKQQSRPKIAESMNPDIATMIRCCWQQDISKRPGIGNVLEALEGIKEQLLG